MMKKFAMAAALSLALLPAAAAFGQAPPPIRVQPPAPIVEHPGPRPYGGAVWVSGYHRWDGARYVWVPGRWDRPPRPRARWVPAHYVHRQGGWILVEGHWR
jgi:hypothetical protein